MYPEKLSRVLMGYTTDSAGQRLMPKGGECDVTFDVIRLEHFAILFSYDMNPPDFDSLPNLKDPANMYIWDPYGQNLGIYPICVLHGPHIGFFAYIRPI